MVKNILVAVLAMPTVFVAACGGGSAPSSSSTSTAPVTVGVVLLSGALAANEEIFNQGFDLALAELNKKGILGGRRIVLERCEDQANPDQSTACVRKFVDEGLKAVIVDTTSPVALVDQQILQRAKVVAILPSQDDTALTEQGNQYLFRTCGSGAIIVRDIVPAVIKQLHPATVAIVGDNTTYGQDVAKRLKTAFEGQQVTTTYSGFFGSTETNFADLLTKVKATNPDVLMVNTNVNSGSILIQQAKSLGLKATIVGSATSLSSPQVLTLTKGAMDGQYAVNTIPPYDTSEGKAFSGAYQAKYTSTPPIGAAQAYTSLVVLANAIDKAGTSTNADKIRQALNDHTYGSPLGIVKFDAKGQNVNIVAYLVQARNGQFVKL